MKRNLIPFLLIFFAASIAGLGADDFDAVRKVAVYRDSTDARIQNGELYRRELRIEYWVVPGIGTPVSLVTAYDDMLDLGEGDYMFSLLKLDHYYQHAGMAFREEFLYAGSGEPVYCRSLRGPGDINQPEDIEWNTVVEHYFSAGKAIKIVTDGEELESPDEEMQSNAQGYFAHAKALRQAVIKLKFPQPYGFINQLP